MNQLPSNALPHLTITNVTSWAPEWQKFQKAHSSWLAGFDLEEPIYCIPEKAIKKLSSGNKKGKKLLTPTTAAENDFTKLCEKMGYVGVWNEQGVVFGNFLRKPAPLSQSMAQLASIGCSPEFVKLCQKALDAFEPLSRRNLGVPGWLLTEPIFLRERDELKCQWCELPNSFRPPFPLGRATSTASVPEQATAASPEVAGFFVKVRQFLDKWGLMQMATWDLPAPQGPLLPSPLPAGSPATPQHGIFVFVPIHYHLQQNDDLIREIERCQKEKATELNIPKSLAGLPHPEGYARLFEVLHLERSIRSRFPSGRIAHGQMIPMENAIAAALSISVDAVKQARKAIATCLRGQRDRVKWLKPRVR